MFRRFLKIRKRTQCPEHTCDPKDEFLSLHCDISLGLSQVYVSYNHSALQHCRHILLCVFSKPAPSKVMTLFCWLLYMQLNALAKKKKK